MGKKIHRKQQRILWKPKMIPVKDLNLKTVDADADGDADADAVAVIIAYIVLLRFG